MKLNKDRLKNFLTLFLGLFLSIVIFEIFLRFYHPFEFRVKGNRIILPANKKYRIKNKRIKKLDKIITHTKNSLGFRGEEPPKDFSNQLAFLAVGGSTTECFYLSDDNTWPAVLGTKLKSKFRNVWINNAGMDGHSSYGHIILMEDYIAKIRPSFIIFLVGCNDLYTDDLTEGDQIFLRGLHAHSFRVFLKSLSNHCEIISLALNLYRWKRGVGHYEVPFERLPNVEMPLPERDSLIGRHEQKSLEFKKRVRRLIDISKSNGIEPIFVTQPTLVGYGTDPSTKANLQKIRVDQMNGELFWKILEIYNDAVRKTSIDQNLLLIDLEKELPKDSKYYYDFIHFTNSGAEKVAEILAEHLIPFLAKRSPD